MRVEISDRAHPGPPGPHATHPVHVERARHLRRRRRRDSVRENRRVDWSERR